MLTNKLFNIATTMTHSQMVNLFQKLIVLTWSIKSYDFKIHHIL